MGSSSARTGEVPLHLSRPANPFQDFFATESASGMLLLLCTIVALIWANSPFAQSYHDLWHTHLDIHFMNLHLAHDLHYWINDGLMVLFFLFVGLEIKREVQVGELASPRQAALPIAAAIGGMLLPAGLYLLVNQGGEYQRGWGVPMATDIAFALGILALLGPRVPLGLKVFLTALAIVDDLGAVAVIAIFYTTDLNWSALGLVALITAGLGILNALQVQRIPPYMVLGFFLWLAMLQSGIHATVAGVILAMTIPTRTRIDPEEFLERVRHAIDDFSKEAERELLIIKSPAMQEAIHHLEVACAQVAPPLQRLEHALKPMVAYGIMPVFALSNAGVTLSGDLGAILQLPLSQGIMLGLVLGKPIGIFTMSWVAIRAGWATLPRGVTYKQIAGAGALGGVGFTMALFVGGLAFGKGETLDAAKLSILMASVISAVAGAWLIHACTSTPKIVESVQPPAPTPVS